MRASPRRSRATVLVIAAACVVALGATAAWANTATGRQNPHLRVVAKVTPTRAHVGDTIVGRVTVTNTTRRTLTIQWGATWETPVSGVSMASAGQRLAPGASVHHTFRRTVTRVTTGSYSLSVDAMDRAGQSHARAHASAG